MNITFWRPIVVAAQPKEFRISKLPALEEKILFIDRARLFPDRLPVNNTCTIRGNATWLIFSILRFDVSHTGNATRRIHANGTLRLDVCFRSEI